MAASSRGVWNWKMVAQWISVNAIESSSFQPFVFQPPFCVMSITKGQHLTLGGKEICKLTIRYEFISCNCGNITRSWNAHTLSRRCTSHQKDSTALLTWRDTLHVKQRIKPKNEVKSKERDCQGKWFICYTNYFYLAHSANFIAQVASQTRHIAWPTVCQGDTCHLSW